MLQETEQHFDKRTEAVLPRLAHFHFLRPHCHPHSGDLRVSLPISLTSLILSTLPTSDSGIHGSPSDYDSWFIN
jgi:hypothetical protein